MTKPKRRMSNWQLLFLLAYFASVAYLAYLFSIELALLIK